MVESMDKKKIAAAMAAVYLYIRTGEEAAGARAGEESETPPAEPAPMGNVWGVSGRQAMMNAGTMMQLRMFR